jgi:hypothetical protein
MAIPSQARKHFREGVETRRAAPKPHTGNGEGIVQTTNPPLAGRRKPKWYENPQTLTGRGGSSPPARTKVPSAKPGWNHPGMFWAGTGPLLPGTGPALLGVGIRTSGVEFLDVVVRTQCFAVATSGH